MWRELESDGFSSMLLSANVFYWNAAQVWNSAPEPAAAQQFVLDAPETNFQRTGCKSLRHDCQVKRVLIHYLKSS